MEVLIEDIIERRTPVEDTELREEEVTRHTNTGTTTTTKIMNGILKKRTIQMTLEYSLLKNLQMRLREIQIISNNISPPNIGNFLIEMFSKKPLKMIFTNQYAYLIELSWCVGWVLVYNLIWIINLHT